MAGSGTAVPSKLFVDLEINMENADNFANSTQPTYTNRTSSNGNATSSTIAGIIQDADEAISTAVSSAGYQIVGDFADAVKVQITSDNQVYTSKSIVGFEDYVWRTNQTLPYTPTGSDPTQSPEDGNWLAVAIGELATAMIALNKPLTVGIYSTDTATPIPEFIRAQDQQLTYSVPADAQGKFISSVVGDVLNTTVGGPYKLESINRSDLKMTLADAIADISLLLGDSVRVTDRGDGLFDVVTGETPNGIDIINATASGYQLQLRVVGNITFEMLGGEGDYLILGTPHTVNPLPTDNYPIVERAYAMGIRTLYAGNGTYAFNTGNLNVFTDKPFSIEGAGGVQPEIIGGSLVDIYTTGTVLVNNSTDNSLFTLGSPTSFLTNASALRHLTLSGSDAQLANQHSLLFTGHMHSFTLDDVSFVNVTGYGWCWDTAGNAYSQNISWRDVSMFNVGGIIGNTSEPVGGDNEIYSTLFEFDNFNLDHQINPVSPQDYICDLRGMRAINGTNFLIEGANGGGTTAGEYIAFGSDENVVMNNVHLEGLSGFPATWITFKDTAGSAWLGDANSSIRINGLEAASALKFVFEGNSKANVTITDFRCQAQLSGQMDWIVFEADYVGSRLHLDGFDSRKGYRSLVPEALKGKVKVTNNSSTSASGGDVPSNNPALTSVLSPLFKYRPDLDGKWGGLQTPYFTTILDSTYTQDEVITFDNTACHVLNQSGSRGAFIKVQCALPSYLVGCTLTFVARYYISGSVSTKSFEMFENFQSLTPNLQQESSLPLATNNSWFTVVGTISNAPADLLIESTSTVGLSGGLVISLAAYDIYLGSDYIEPYDLRTAPVRYP